jgi:hypothetical protein
MPFTLWASEEAQEEAARASVSFRLVVLDLGIVGGTAGLDDIEGEAALELHAGGAEDGTKGARGASLFANDFTNVAGSDVKAKDGGFLVGNCFDADRVGIVDEGPGNFGH